MDNKTKDIGPIPEDHKRAAKGLVVAAALGKLCVVRAWDKATGEPCSLIAYVRETQDNYELQPLARLFGPRDADGYEPVAGMTRLEYVKE